MGHVTTRLPIPGAGTLETDRDAATGSLLAIRGGGRDYLAVDADGTWCWHGLCTARDTRDADGLTRRVRSRHTAWVEHYRWRAGRLCHVDGVDVRRDEHGRVVACLPGGPDPVPATHRWSYAQDDRGLVGLAWPGGARTIGLGRDGRARTVVEDGVLRGLDPGGRSGPGAREHVDAAGRCWATYRPDGGIEHVYLWDGTRCLARVDGPLGEPAAAVFSLDPSATPVRVVTPERDLRIPRDAYGEGLLAHPGVPGLYGGHVRGGLVHLPLRRLDPRTGTFCEPDPHDGRPSDPRRGAGRYEGPLPVEPEPRSAYEVCRGDPVGRADPTGGLSWWLVLSDLTWSLQNNILTFFGLDWWFNLFGSLLLAPSSLQYDFFSATALSSTHGSFGLRRDGLINAIAAAEGQNQVFTTQHIVWSYDSEFADLDRGDVVDPLGSLELTHYGTVLDLAPAGRPRRLHRSMQRAGWAGAALPGWTRHGGLGVAVAPGVLTPWYPAGGLHLDRSLTDTRGTIGCTISELAPATVALGDLEERTFLTAGASTRLTAGDRVLVEDGAGARAMARVVATVAAGTGERVQLDEDLVGLGPTGLTMIETSATPVSTESRGAGALPSSIDVHGTTATYATGDLLRLVAASGEVTLARVTGLEARLPLERPLPAGLTGPLTLTRGVVGAASTTITIAGAEIDFGGASRPVPGTPGLVSGGGVDVAVRIESHVGATRVTFDIPLPPAVTGAPKITFRSVTPGTALGSRAEAAESDPVVTYVPVAAGVAPDGGAGLVVLRVSAPGGTHARRVTAPPAHDVALLDRAPAGTAPFTVERFPTTAPAFTALVRADVTGLVVPDPAPFAAAPAVALTKVQGEPPAAGTAVAAGVSVVAGAFTAAAVLAPVGLGNVLLVGSRPAVVRTVRATVTFDRALDLSASGLRLVQLVATGHAYRAQALAGDVVLVEPQVTVGGAAVDTPFPRFLAGDVVEVTGGGPPTWHRVTTAAAGRLRLAGGPALVAGTPVTVRAAAVRDPRNGGPYLGVDGFRAGTGPTTTGTFSLWATDAAANGTVIGVVDGSITHPSVLTGTTSVEVRFSEAFDAPAVTVARVTSLATDVRPGLARDGGVLLLDGPPGALLTAANESIVAVAYTPEGLPRTGTIGPGTLLVPEREGTEVDRRQSLVDHELTHTLQYADLGPLWFAFLPMVALELPGILASDTELPEFSRFLEGTLEAGPGTRWTLALTGLSGVPIAPKDELQVVQGSQRATVTVRSVDGTTFEVTANEGAPPTGRVSVRKRQGNSWLEVPFAVLDLLTHGGLVNVTAGTTWAGIIWLLAKGVYGLGRAIAGTGDLYPATVQAGGGALSVTNAADANRIPTSGTVVVRQGDNTVVRTMTRAATVVTLDAGVTFTGDVLVAPYDTHNPRDAFDWHDYFPATVDPANPYVVDVAAVGSRTLALAPEDRVTIRYRDKSQNTDVVSVDGTRAELASPIAVVGDERSLRIARFGSDDPLGNADTAGLTALGMGWMKWVFDPYGQLARSVRPDNEWAQWLLRVMRWLLGSQSFSVLLPGYLFWFWGIKPKHLTGMEQDASEQSGDLYTTLGRLYGQRRELGFARHSMVVGDVARYRIWENARAASHVVGGLFDAPGDRYDGGPGDSKIRVLPSRSPAAPADPPTLPVGLDPVVTDPGTFVAEAFTFRNASTDPDPRLVPGGDALGFRPSELGQVPVGPRTERMVSAYVAFSRPGPHRVTVRTVDTESEEASREKVQKLFFDVEVDPVTVTVAAQPVGDGMPPARVVLVPFQRADVVVAPNAARSYRVEVPDPDGAFVRTDGLRLVGRAPSGGALVPVEISRFYAVAGGSYGPGGLASAGMHLSRDVHVPVRRFTIEVADSVPLRAAVDPTAAELTTLTVGAAGFLLVPAPVTRPPSVTTVAGNPPPAGAPNPVTRVDGPVAFLGTAGSAFQVQFPAGSPVGPVVMTVRVGDLTAFRDLSVTFSLIA